MQIAAKNIAKKYRNLIRKKPYGKPPLRKVTFKNDDLPINDLSNIAALKPSKNAQIAAKKINEKYKNIRSKKKQSRIRYRFQNDRFSCS